MNDQTSHETLTGGAENAAEAAIAASIKIDYEKDLAMTEPDQPGGRIVYDSGDYETDEEADAALEAFVNRIIEAPYAED